MIVQINTPFSPLPELCILEFQGELVGEFKGVLGELTLKQADKVEMVIGNHLLEGNFQSLKNPLLVLDNCQSQSAEAELSNSTDLQVNGVVRRKIIFKTRPKPAGFKRTRVEADLV